MSGCTTIYPFCPERHCDCLQAWAIMGKAVKKNLPVGLWMHISLALLWVNSMEFESEIG